MHPVPEVVCKYHLSVKSGPVGQERKRMSVYEAFEATAEKFDHVVCVDKETGERFHDPSELPIDLAGQDCGKVKFVKERE